MLSTLLQRATFHGNMLYKRYEPFQVNKTLYYWNTHILTMCPAYADILVQILMTKGGGGDRLTGNKIEDSWVMLVEQVRVYIC